MHDDAQLLSFELELIKLGAPAKLLQLARKAVQSPALQRGLGGAGAGAGVGGLGGAAIGAGVGGTRAYRKAREEGATGGEAALQALSGGGSGAVKGGLIGAGVGGAGLGAAAAKGLAPQAAGRLAATGGPVGSAARFGQRQVHSLTGWTPKGFHSPKGVRQIRGGAHAAGEAKTKARKALREAKTPKETAKAQKGFERAQKAFGAAEEAERMGLTSIPGYAKALARSPGKALRAGVGEQWHSGPMGKAFVLAPGALAAKELATEGEPGDEGRLERAGKAMGTLAYTAGPLPMLGSVLAGGAASETLGAGGRLLDRPKKGKKKGAVRPRPENPAPPSLEPAGGAATVDEYVYSPSAMGERPSVGYGV